jgi:hypothetical protein
MFNIFGTENSFDESDLVPAWESCFDQLEYLKATVNPAMRMVVSMSVGGCAGGVGPVCGFAGGLAGVPEGWGWSVGWRAAGWGRAWAGAGGAAPGAPCAKRPLSPGWQPSAHTRARLLALLPQAAAATRAPGFRVTSTPSTRAATRCSWARRATAAMVTFRTRQVGPPCPPARHSAGRQGVPAAVASAAWSAWHSLAPSPPWPNPRPPASRVHRGNIRRCRRPHQRPGRLLAVQLGRRGGCPPVPMGSATMQMQGVGAVKWRWPCSSCRGGKC